MSKVKNFHKWFKEDVQEGLTRYKKFPDGDISTRFRLRYDNIEVCVRLPRERHSSWRSLDSLCTVLEWRVEMTPEDEHQLRDFITAEAKPLLDARAAEKAKRQQQSKQAQQKAQDAAAYVTNLEAENAQLTARIAELEKAQAFFNSPLFYFNLEDITELGYDISCVSKEDLEDIASYFAPDYADEYTEILTRALDDLAIPKLA